MVKTNYIFHRLPALVAGMHGGESQGLAKKFRAIAGKVGFLALVLSAGPIHA